MVFRPNVLVAVKHEVRDVQPDSVKGYELCQSVCHLEQETRSPPADHGCSHTFAVLHVAVVDGRHGGHQHLVDFREFVVF